MHTTLSQRSIFYAANTNVRARAKGEVGLARPSATVPAPQVFLLRFWFEVLDPQGQGEWRGEVRLADGKRHAYFREWDKLTGFLEQVLAASERAAREGGPG